MVFAATGFAANVNLVERATSDAVLDLGEKGDTVGDILTFANEIYDQAISMFRIPLAAASATILLILSLTILAVVNLISARLLPRVGD